MNREPTSPPIETWQFYSACLHHLGMQTLNAVYCGIKAKACLHCGKEINGSRQRQIHRWSANPDTTESAQRNPVDRYETLLDRLMALGHADIARAAVGRQAHKVGCFLQLKQIPKSDKATVAEECLNDLSAVAEYHAALLNPDATVNLIRETRAKAVRELDQDYRFWCEENGIIP